MKIRLFVVYFIMSAGLAVLAADSVVGVITTVAGDGTVGSSGDGGPATLARLNDITGMAVDSADNLYIADAVTNTIRKVTPGGVISTAVGSSAGLSGPGDLAVDSAGNLYIVESSNRRIVKVTPAGAVSTIAEKIFPWPTAVAVDAAGNVYYGDTAVYGYGSRQIHKVSPDGSISIFCPTANRDAWDLAFDSAGNLFMAERSQVLKVDPQGRATVIPCSGAMDLAVDRAGNLFVAGVARIQMVTPEGIISTVAGTGTEGFGGDGGPATSAQLSGSLGVAVDSTGNLFLGDSKNHRIRRITWLSVSETYFPQVTVGGGYYTTFALSNTGDSVTSGELILTDQQGEPLIASGTDLGAGSSFPVSIAPAGTMFLTVDPLDADGPVRTGWAKTVTLGGALHGVATFHLTSAGTRQAATAVLPSQPMRYGTIPVDDDSGQERLTAYALANPTTQDVVIKLALVDQDGTVVDDTVTFTLRPKQQIARYLYQDLAREQFKGSIVLRAQEGASFVAVALMQRQKMFTVVPVIPGKASSIPD